jgi:enoyl-CoA hydratase/carnithine racemase
MAEYGENLFKGPAGYVQLTEVEHQGKRGAVLRYINPDPRKLHAVDVTGLRELNEAVAAVEQQAGDLEFLVLHGAYDPLHAGADVTQFDGDPDIDAIREHMYRGVELDARIKQLWPQLRTVGVLCGNRFGGSVEWPLFAQYGVCDSATTIQLSEVQLGILPGWNGILNVMLRSNASNAQYLASTGNPLTADEMLAANIVQSVVDAPPPPDRKLTPEADYPAQWQAHAEAAQQRLLETALDFATNGQEISLGTDYQLADAEDYFAEIGRRTQDSEYRELRLRIEDQLAALGSEPAPEAVKALTRLVASELATLGKPLAPDAVNFVQRYVKQFGALSQSELLERYAELGRIEADLCVELMSHPHRREGVRAVLTKNPAERVPVFAEVNYSEELISPYEV